MIRNPVYNPRGEMVDGVIPMAQCAVPICHSTNSEAKDRFQMPPKCMAITDPQLLTMVRRCHIDPAECEPCDYVVNMFHDRCAFPLYGKPTAFTVGCFPASVCAGRTPTLSEVVEQAQLEIALLEDVLRCDGNAAITHVTVWKPHWCTPELFDLVTKVVSLAVEDTLVAAFGDTFPDLPAFGYDMARLDFVAFNSVSTSNKQVTDDYGANVAVFVRRTHAKRSFSNGRVIEVTATPRKYTNHRGFHYADFVRDRYVPEEDSSEDEAAQRHRALMVDDAFRTDETEAQRGKKRVVPRPFSPEMAEVSEGDAVESRRLSALINGAIDEVVTGDDGRGRFATKTKPLEPSHPPPARKAPRGRIVAAPMPKAASQKRKGSTKKGRKKGAATCCACKGGANNGGLVLEKIEESEEEAEDEEEGHGRGASPSGACDCADDGASEASTVSNRSESANSLELKGAVMAQNVLAAWVEMADDSSGSDLEADECRMIEEGAY